MTQSTKKRILLLDPASFMGGAERFAVELANHVDLDRFELWVAHQQNAEYEKSLHSKIRQVIVDLPQLRIKNIFKIFRAIKKLRKILKKNKIQLLQSNSVRSHIVGSLAAQKTGAKVLWFLHDFTFPGKLIRFFSRFPEKILCCSDAVKHHVSKQIPESFRQKLGRFLNGVNFEHIQKEWLTQNKIDPPVLGIIGRIDRWKGQRYFIEAAAEVLKTYPNIQFYIIGEPNQLDEDNVKYFEELKSLIQQRSLEKTVIFKGHCFPIFQEMSGLSMLIHCSTDPEPFGRTIIEAMALGKPVIATAHGGPLETVTEDETGFLILPRDSKKLAETILKCLKNPQKMEKMGQTAQKIAQKKYDLKVTVKTIEDIWDTIK